MARALIKQVGFPAAWLNRHYLVAGAEQGDDSAKSRLEKHFSAAAGIPLGAVLAALARQGEHPPYHSYYTLWLANPERIAFTKNPGEGYFHSVVNATNVSFARAAELLKPLQAGDIPLDHGHASAALKAAQAEVAGLHGAYNFLKRNVASGEMRMTPEFFMRRLRGYIAPALIGVMEIEGPNATYSPGWPRLDFALDNREAFYVDAVTKRYPWMVPEHRTLLDQALELPALTDQILSHLGLRREQPEVGSAVEAAWFAGDVNQATRALIRAYASLVETFTNVSGTHLSIIRNYLVRPAAKLSSEELSRIVPNPNAGVRGNLIKHTEAIFDMRKGHRVNRILMDLVRGLG